MIRVLGLIIWDECYETDMEHITFFYQKLRMHSVLHDSTYYNTGVNRFSIRDRVVLRWCDALISFSATNVPNLQLDAAIVFL